MENFKNITRYNSPISDDIVVCLVSFNAGGFIRPLMNNHYVINILENSGIPYYLIELSYMDEAPRFPNKENIIHVRCNSYMFHKENLFNLLVNKLPSKYTKIVCMDGDVLMGNNNWINDVSERLDECDVLMPYNESYQIEDTLSSAYLSGITMLNNILEYHNASYKAGYCICFNRRFFNEIGLYEYAIMGGGDRMTLSQFVKRPIMINSFNSNKKNEYIYNIRKKNYTFGWLDDNIYHLPHGSIENRKYLDRHFLMSDLNIDTNLIKNKEGVLEFIEPNKYNNEVKKYFLNREEDLI